MFDWGRTRKLLLYLLVASLLFEVGIKYERSRQAREAGVVEYVESGTETAAATGPGSDGEEATAAGAGGDQPAAGGTTVTEVVWVHVVGAVKVPGVYCLELPARVNDAVNLAGPADDADLAQINLAEPVSDGQQVFVPRKGETVPDSAGSFSNQPQTRAVSGKININTATAAELDAGLPGIGPTLANRIVEYRKTHGPFRSVAELQNVSGIGAKRYAELKDKVVVK